MFVNHSNHPSSMWGEKQKEVAQEYGEIIDVPFPTIPSLATESDIKDLVLKYAETIFKLKPVVVLCQGEFTYTYAMVACLKEQGIPVVAACSERNVVEQYDGNTSKKIVSFEFVKFRKYL